jgi:hypothetical protein
MALFKDIEDLATVHPVLESTDWRVVQPFVETKEAELVRDELLGETLYAALHASYQASIAVTPVAMTPPLSNLLPFVRKPLAYLSMHDAMPMLGVQYTGAGPMEHSTQNVQPARMWKQRDAAARMLATGNSLLNQCVQHLLDNESDYPDWAVAPVRMEARGSLIPDMRAVRPYMKLHGAWLLHQLRPALLRIQTGPVKSLLGDEYDTLLAAVVAGNPDADQQMLLDQARPAMLHRAIAEEADGLQLTIDVRGVWTWNMTGGGGGQISGGEQQAENPRMVGLKRHHNNMAEQHMEALRKLVQPENPNPGRIGGRGRIFFGG